MRLCFSASSDEGSVTGRHGNRVRDNSQLVLVPTTDCLRWYPVTGHHCVIIRRGDDHE